MPVGEPARVEKIGRKRRVPALMRIAIDVIIRKKPFLLGFVLALGQPDDDHMDMGLAARVGPPGEGAVGEGDLKTAAAEQKRPELRTCSPWVIELVATKPMRAFEARTYSPAFKNQAQT
jgi:hypothetical protein